MESAERSTIVMGAGPGGLATGYWLAKHGIPVIFYFNGTHEDYHQHTDEVDKIQFDILESRSKLIFYTAWELANRDKRPVGDKKEK